MSSAFQRSWNHETPPLAIPSRPGHRSAEFPPAPSFWRLGKKKTFFEGFLGTQSASLNQLKGNSSLYKKTETCWVSCLKVCGPCAFARLAEAKVMRRVANKTLKIHDSMTFSFTRVLLISGKACFLKRRIYPAVIPVVLALFVAK